MTVGPSKIGLRERLRVCRGEARNQLRGLKEGGSARRGAMLCLSADLTTHALPLFKQAFYPVLKDMKMGGKDDGVKVFNAAKYGSVKVFIVVQERRASRSPSWRRSAAKDGKVTLTLGVYRGAGAAPKALNDSARAKRDEVCGSVTGARR